MKQRLRFGVVLLFVGLACGLLARAQTSQKTPVVISIYALHQEDSPVRIAQLRYTNQGIIATVVNDSEKPVTGVRMVAHAIAPPGCGSAVGHPYFLTSMQGLTAPIELPPAWNSGHFGRNPSARAGHAHAERERLAGFADAGSIHGCRSGVRRRLEMAFERLLADSPSRADIS